MCGISGVVGELDDLAIRGLRAADVSQDHRGPDDAGFWRSEVDSRGRGAAFAHRRLAILDLTSAGRQPMLDPERGNVICFNGEVYNFPELREELKRLGESFRSRTDTEVVLRAYSRWGPACVERFRGMFALAVWDSRRRSVFLARDRLGIKPLYWTRVAAGSSQYILFTSELRALLASGLVARRMSPQALKTYLWHGFVVGEQALVDGVNLLPAGTTTWVSLSGHLEPPHLYRGAPGVSPGETLERTLEEAVRSRLVSDVPIAVFLSGGIDSSAVAALAARHAPSTLNTFNVSFEEIDYDEAPHARAVAEVLGTDHHEIRVTQAAFRSQLDDALDSLDQPTFDAINTYVISRAVRESGIKVALSGAGGDELFGGYPSFRDIPRVRAMGWIAGVLPGPVLQRLAAGVTRARLGRPGCVAPQTRWGKLGDALAARGDLIRTYQVAYSLFSREFLHELLPAAPQSGWGLPDGRREELAVELRGLSELAAISSLELRSFVAERLLRDTDCASMAVSLEVRVPLLDHEVIGAAAALRPRLRYRPLGAKMALRRAALSELPSRLFDRPKAGFVLPIEPWSRAALYAELEATLSDRTGCKDAGLDPEAVARLWRAYAQGAVGIYWSRVWAIFVLLRWLTRHSVRL